MNKKDIIEDLNILKNLMTKSELIDNTNIDIFNSIIFNIQEFKVYLPLIGNFNAGKSSILNSILKDEDLLPTDIIPKTAVATEIIFSEDERVEVYNFEDNKPIKVFQDLSILKKEEIIEYDYIKLYKNSEFLSKTPDIVLVDMPGLDSNIERHNQRILKYMAKEAVSFIVVIDIDDGTIKESTLRFINEIDSYKIDFFLLINKIDKKPLSEVKKIKNSITIKIATYAKKQFVGTVSSFDENIKDFYNLIALVDQDSYIKKTFLNDILYSIDITIQDLIVRKEAICIDIDEINKKIENLINKIYQFENILRAKEQSIEHILSIDILNNILKDIEISLYTNIDKLSYALTISEDNFKITVNDIIRPTIINSIRRNIEKELIKVLEELQTENIHMLKSIYEFSKGKEIINTDKILLKYRRKTFRFLDNSTINSILGFLLEAIPTIALISYILMLTIDFFRDESQDSLNCKFKEKLQKNIIPKITKEIKPKIRNILNETKENFFKELENSINDQKEQLIASLERAKEEKEKYKNEIKSKIEEFDNTIESLNNIYKDIELKYS